MKEKTCCFTGHRDIIENQNIVKARLKKELIRLIDKGVCYFGCGGARGFDLLAGEVVLELKKSYSHIKLVMVLPCRNQTRGWLENDINLYNQVMTNSDKSVYVSETYFNGCMQKRNRHLVDNSAYCVCYKNRESGGTAYTVSYANQQGLTVINVCGE